MSVFDKVKLVNKGSKFTDKWDGQEFSINKNKHEVVVRGLAEHFIEKHKNNDDVKLEVKEIEEEEPEPRKREEAEEQQEEAFGELEEG